MSTKKWAIFALGVVNVGVLAYVFVNTTIPTFLYVLLSIFCIISEFLIIFFLNTADNKDIQHILAYAFKEALLEQNEEIENDKK